MNGIYYLVTFTNSVLVCIIYLFAATYPAGLIVYLSIAFGAYFFVLIPLIHYVYNIVLLRSIYYMMDELDRRQTSGVQSSSYELVSLPQPPEKQDPEAEEISAV